MAVVVSDVEAAPVTARTLHSSTGGLHGCTRLHIFCARRNSPWIKYLVHVLGVLGWCVAGFHVTRHLRYLGLGTLVATLVFAHTRASIMGRDPFRLLTVSEEVGGGYARVCWNKHLIIVASLTNYNHFSEH